MIVGLGTDLIGHERIRGVYRRRGERFLERVYRAEERCYCLRQRDPVPSLAARWAAKEACMKALGTGWARGIGFTDIEVVRGDDAPPVLVLHDQAAALAGEIGVRNHHVSLSHSDGLAIATVILEG